MKFNKKLNLLMIALLAFNFSDGSQNNLTNRSSEQMMKDHDYKKFEKEELADPKNNKPITSFDPSSKGTIITKVTFKPISGDAKKVVKITEIWTPQSKQEALKSQDAVKESKKTAKSGDATAKDAKKDESSSWTDYGLAAVGAVAGAAAVYAVTSSIANYRQKQPEKSKPLPLGPKRVTASVNFSNVRPHEEELFTEQDYKDFLPRYTKNCLYDNYSLEEYMHDAKLLKNEGIDIDKDFFIQGYDMNKKLDYRKPQPIVIPNNEDIGSITYASYQFQQHLQDSQYALQKEINNPKTYLYFDLKALYPDVKEYINQVNRLKPFITNVAADQQIEYINHYLNNAHYFSSSNLTIQDYIQDSRTLALKGFYVDKPDESLRCGNYPPLLCMIAGRVYVGATDSDDSKDIEVARALLRAGANPNIDYNSQKPLHIAVIQEKWTPFIQDLINARADVNAQDLYMGYSPLHGMGINCLGRRLEKKLTPEAAQILINNGANIEARNRLEETPLMEAVENNNLEVVQVLLNAGADVNANNNSGDTALSIAICNNYSDIVTAIINCNQPTSEFVIFFLDLLKKNETEFAPGETKFAPELKDGDREEMIRTLEDSLNSGLK